MKTAKINFRSIIRIIADPFEWHPFLLWSFAFFLLAIGLFLILAKLIMKKITWMFHPYVLCVVSFLLLSVVIFIEHLTDLQFWSILIAASTTLIITIINLCYQHLEVQTNYETTSYKFIKNNQDYKSDAKGGANNFQSTKNDDDDYDNNNINMITFGLLDSLL